MVSFIAGTIVSISQLNSFLSEVLLLMPSNNVEEHIFLMLSADEAIVLLSISFFSLHVVLNFENESLCIWAFALMEVTGDLCSINGVKSLFSLIFMSGWLGITFISDEGTLSVILLQLFSEDCSELSLNLKRNDTFLLSLEVFERVTVSTKMILNVYFVSIYIYYTL